MLNTTSNNNALVNSILANRGFSNARINAKTLDTEIVKEWHALLDNVHSASYHVASTCYNNSILDTTAPIDYSPIYSAMAKVWEYLGSINGGKLSSDANTATTLMSKATREAVKKSANLQYVLSQKSNSVRYLKQLESINGVKSETIEKVKSDIESFDNEIAQLKSESGNQFKQFAKCSASVFYKAVEDYIADMLEKRLCMTEEEVRAEAEAKRAERRAKTAQKKAQKNSAK